ncbi:MAG: TldD/PmbA family protein [Gemmatimonadales bacterium]|nr:TldD/PmbA family protein [Gemmatimonadales bacterium]
MAGFTEAEAKALLQKALAYSKADACEVNLDGSTRGNVRYARNAVSTAGVTDDLSMVVQSSFGQRQGTVTLNEFDDASIERAVRRSEELARLAPEDPEFQPPLGPQRYSAVPHAFVERTAAYTPAERAAQAKASIEPAKRGQCTAAGFLEDGAAWSAMANSAGLFAYHRSTGGEYTVTVRTDDGTGSGYASQTFNDVAELDAGKVSGLAQAKALASREAKAIEPGKYTVIMEPLATVDLLSFMFFNMDARNADEGRSFLTRKGGGTRVGEKLFDGRVQIWSDPTHPVIPSAPWSGDGRAQQRVDWVKDGTVQQLFYSRFWARKQGKDAVPPPTNLLMAGGSGTVDDLVRDTKRGILVTRTWYIRMVDPQTVLLTGLTRDGTFFVEDGRVKHAVKNLRFNESPVIMLNNIDALGAPVRVGGGEGGPVSLIPPMRVRDFTFTSLSDAV